MENATKALLIAAAILIAIVLISLGVYVLGQGTTMVKEADMSEVEITAFNNKFEAYFGTKVSGSKAKQLQKTVDQYNRTAETEMTLTLPEGISTLSTADVYSISGTYSDSGLLTAITITKPEKESE